MRNKVHMCRIKPHEKWFSVFMLLLDKIFGCRNKFVIAGFHPFFGQRSCILNFLLANFSLPGHFCRIILFCGPGVHHTTRAKSFKELGKFFF